MSVLRIVLATVLFSGILWGCSDSDEPGNAAGDNDVEATEVTENESDGEISYRYIDCDEEFDPWAVESKRYTIAPYSINPTKDSITIMWETLENTPSFILWGVEGTLDTVQCVHDPERIPIVSDEIDEEHDGWLYHATLDHLDSQVNYAYTLPNAEIPVPTADNTWNEEREFQAFTGGRFVLAPEPGERFTMVIVGDNQGIPTMHETVILHMKENLGELLFHLGDIVHNGIIEQYRGNYFLLSSPLLTQMASVHIAGNHEGHGETVPYDALFRIPDAGTVMMDGEAVHPGKRAFTYDYGHVRFFVLDSEMEMRYGSPQLAWLDDRLERTRNEDEHIQFLICAWHRPTYSLSSGRYEYPKEDLHEVMVRRHVDLVLNGHDHNYQRFEQDGLTYLVTGGAGAVLTPIHLDYANSDDNLVVGEQALHFVKAEFGPETAEFVALRSEDGEEIDRFTLPVGQHTER